MSAGDEGIENGEMRIENEGGDEPESGAASSAPTTGTQGASEAITIPEEDVPLVQDLIGADASTSGGINTALIITGVAALALMLALAVLIVVRHKRQEQR